MKSYALKIQQNYKTVLVLVLVPAVSVLAFIFCMVQFPLMPEWLAYTFIVLFLTGLTAAILWLAVNKLSAACCTTVNSEGIVCTPMQASFLYFKVITFRWDQIISIGDHWDLRTGTRYLKIKSTKRFRNLTLTVGENHDEILEAFYDMVPEKYKE